MTKQAETRRLQDTLSIAGTAVIAFGVWSLAKIIVFLTLVDENVLQQLLGISDTPLTITVYVSLGIIILIDLGLRSFVGLSARAEGRGRKKKPFYLVVAAVMAIANASSLAAIAFGTSFASSPLNMIVSIIIEATSLTALVLVVHSAIRLRQTGKTAG